MNVQQMTPNGNFSDRLECQYNEMNILERKPIFYLKWSVYNDKAKSDFFRIKQYSSQPLPQNDQKIPTPIKGRDKQTNNQKNQVPAKILQIEVEHEFIYDEIKRLYTSGELNYIKDGPKVEFQSRNIIKVTTKSENSIEVQKCFGEILQNLEKNLYESTCEMSEIVKNHIQQQMKSELRQFQDLFKINFKFEKNYLKPKPSVSLKFGLQKITIIQENLSMLECEAIANISTSKVQLNNTQNTDEIDYNIFAMAGTEYIQIGMWGPGIYFAEKASYSREYSYKLTPSDDKDNAGKLVFLCCLITTGKVEVKQPDKSIKRPSTGYDCVSGFTNGSDVFILYSMDIRRAYPAYEIIYT